MKNEADLPGTALPSGAADTTEHLAHSSDKNEATVAKFRRAVEDADVDTAVGLMTPDVRLYSPLKANTIGRREVDGGFVRWVRNAFPADFRFTGTLRGTAEDHDGRALDSYVLPFRAGEDYSGVLMLQLDQDGLISTLTVHSTLRALVAAVGGFLNGMVDTQLASTT